MGKSSRPIQAAIHRERRQSGRYVVQLTAMSPAGDDRALIHDLSEVGLRLETSLTLDRGDVLRIELPLIGEIDAKIVWKEGAFLGCEFLQPVSQGIVNAAILRSSAKVEALPDKDHVEEIPIGVNPTLETITEWKVQFDQERGAAGYRLVGFRQDKAGVTLAMITRID